MHEHALSLVRLYEGLRLSPYQDTGGVWTIGYGATRDLEGRRVSRDTKPITEAEAERLLSRDFQLALDAVAHYVKVPLAPNQHATLASFVFNLGETAFAASTLLRLLNKGAYSVVPRELRRWVYDNGKKLPGLVSRREAEANLWYGPQIAQDAPGSTEPVSAPTPAVSGQTA